MDPAPGYDRAAGTVGREPHFLDKICRWSCQVRSSATIRSSEDVVVGGVGTG